jgi:hypothetical protein
MEFYQKVVFEGASGEDAEAEDLGADLRNLDAVMNALDIDSSDDDNNPPHPPVNYNNEDFNYDPFSGDQAYPMGTNSDCPSSELVAPASAAPLAALNVAGPSQKGTRRSDLTVHFQSPVSDPPRLPSRPKPTPTATNAGKPKGRGKGKGKGKGKAPVSTVSVGPNVNGSDGESECDP